MNYFVNERLEAITKDLKGDENSKKTPGNK